MGRATKRTYFLLAPKEKLVKIGESIEPTHRITQLRLMNATPVEALAVTDASEKELHQRFSHLRHHGEWFKVSEEIAEYLQTNEFPLAAERLRKVKDALYT